MQEVNSFQNTEVKQSVEEQIISSDSQSTAVDAFGSVKSTVAEDKVINNLNTTKSNKVSASKKPKRVVNIQDDIATAEAVNLNKKVEVSKPELVKVEKQPKSASDKNTAARQQESTSRRTGPVQGQKLKEFTKQADDFSIDSADIPNLNKDGAKKLHVRTEEIFDRPSTFMFTAKHVLTRIIEGNRYKKLVKYFERGEKIKAAGFYFYLMNRELMAFSYVGTKSIVEIPAYVEDYPVRYLHSDLLNGKGLDNHTIRSAREVINSSNHGYYRNVEGLLSGIRAVILPDTVLEIPPDFLKGCTRVREITIPESVEFVAPTAFSNSGIVQIFFEGEAPDAIELCAFQKVPTVYVRQKDQDTFYELIVAVQAMRR